MNPLCVCVCTHACIQETSQEDTSQNVNILIESEGVIINQPLLSKAQGNDTRQKTPAQSRAQQNTGHSKRKTPKSERK